MKFTSNVSTSHTWTERSMPARRLEQFRHTHTHICHERDTNSRSKDREVRDSERLNCEATGTGNIKSAEHILLASWLS
jgi:hypothetical protein